jgi:hypothetical protein
LFREQLNWYRCNHGPARWPNFAKPQHPEHDSETSRSSMKGENADSPFMRTVPDGGALLFSMLERTTLKTSHDIGWLRNRVSDSQSFCLLPKSFFTTHARSNDNRPTIAKIRGKSTVSSTHPPRVRFPTMGPNTDVGSSCLSMLFGVELLLSHQSNEMIRHNSA